MKKPELLAPAGNWASLQAAIDSGCDALYFGISELNMRSWGAKNFRLRDLEKIGKLDVKKYLTVNTIIFEDEIEKVRKIITKAKDYGIDAVIVWDLAALKIAKEVGIEAHISTQASVANSIALDEYKKLGAKRVILARELDLEQIKKIKKKTKLEIECFIHGAMCVSISGRCFMSHSLFRKSANRGECFQPCRREYKLVDVETKDSLILGQDYVMSPKDLCCLPILDKIIKTGVDVLKIEGRAKSPEYVSKVVQVYREAIDAFFEGKFEKVKDKLMRELKEVYNRGFNTGFYLDTNPGFTDVSGSKSTKKKIYVGRVLNYYNKHLVGLVNLESKDLKIGDNILVIGNKTGVFEQKVKSLEIEKQKVKEGQKGDMIGIKFDKKVRKNDKIYLFE